MRRLGLDYQALLPKSHSRLIGAGQGASFTDLMRSIARTGLSRQAKETRSSMIPKKFVPVQIEHAEGEKNATGDTEKQTHYPEMALFRESRNRCNGNGDLEHGHGARVNFVPVKIGFCRGFPGLGVRLYLFLLFQIGRAHV